MLFTTSKNYDSYTVYFQIFINKKIYDIVSKKIIFWQNVC